MVYTNIFQRCNCRIRWSIIVESEGGGPAIQLNLFSSGAAYIRVFIFFHSLEVVDRVSETQLKVG